MGDNDDIHCFFCGCIGYSGATKMIALTILIIGLAVLAWAIGGPS